LQTVSIRIQGRSIDVNADPGDGLEDELITRARLLTIAIASAGVALFVALGMPLPYLFGPMAACLLAALAGIRLQGLGEVSTGMRTILGVAVGASLTPALIEQLPVMAVTLALMPVYIALIAAFGVPFFMMVCKFDRVTAYYASMPGGLQDMVIFGQESGGDVRALSLIHATRVLIIISLAPFVLSGFYDVDLTGAIGVAASTIPVSELVIMAIAALVGWKGGERIGLFGAAILGPMIVTGALSLSGVLHYRPPAEAMLAAQYFIGTGIGVHYVGVTLHELRVDVLAGTAFAMVLAALAAAFTVAITLAGVAPPLETFLAFAPGGQAEMTMIAIIAGADLGFVVVHHLVRVVLVIAGAPVAAVLFKIRGKKP